MRLIAILLVMAGAAWAQGRQGIDRLSVQMMPGLEDEVRNKCYGMVTRAQNEFQRMWPNVRKLKPVEREKRVNAFRDKWRTELKNKSGLTAEQ